MEVNTKAILKAAKTVRSFQNAQQEDSHAADLDELVRKRAPATGPTKNEAILSEADRVIMKRNERRTEIFGTKIFQNVIEQVFGE